MGPMMYVSLHQRALRRPLDDGHLNLLEHPGWRKAEPRGPPSQRNMPHALEGMCSGRVDNGFHLSHTPKVTRTNVLNPQLDLHGGVSFLGDVACFTATGRD